MGRRDRSAGQRRQDPGLRSSAWESPTGGRCSASVRRMVDAPAALAGEQERRSAGPTWMTRSPVGGTKTTRPLKRQGRPPSPRWRAPMPLYHMAPGFHATEHDGTAVLAGDLEEAVAEQARNALDAALAH